MWLLAFSACACCYVFAVLVLYWLLPKQRPRTFKSSETHALVTGGSSGIGLEIARQLCVRGCRVTIMARTESKLKATVDAIKTDVGNNALIDYIACDLAASYQEVEKKLAAIRIPVDLLVNCAGYAVAREYDVLAPEEIENMMRTNYFGSAWTTRALLNGMLERGSGSIVFVSSQAGQLGLYGFSAYCPTKFALRGLAESLYHEVVGRGLAVSIAFPPDTDTAGLAAENEGKPRATAAISEGGGLVSSEEVAKLIIDGAERGDFLITSQFVGYFLARVTAGFSVPTSFCDFLLETVFLGVGRLLTAVFQLEFFGKIAKFGRK